MPARLPGHLRDADRRRRGGRATAVDGDPEQPITAGFLCGKVSNYLDRVYADDRLLHPLIRTGAEGRGRVPPRELGRGARRRRRRARAARSTSTAAESILPYSYMGTQGSIQGGSMSARVMNALGATDLVRTICASAGDRRRGRDPGAVARGGPRGVAARPLRPGLGLEPDVDGAASVAKLLEARRDGARLVVVDPFRIAHGQGRRRAPAAAARHRRRARARDDARRPRCRARRRGVVPRAHTDGYDELIERLGEHPVEHWAEMCGVRGGDGGAGRAGVRLHSARPAPPGRRRAAPPRGADRIPDDRLPAGTRRRLATPRRRLLLHPDRDRKCCLERLPRGRRAALGAGTADQHVPARRRAYRRGARPTGEGDGRLVVEPGADRARPGPGARRPGSRGSAHGGHRAVHDRHRRSTPTSSCRRRRSSSISTPSSPGATSTSPSTSPRSSRSARRSRRARPSACSRRDSASTARSSPSPTRTSSPACSRTNRAGSRSRASAPVAGRRSTSARARRPTQMGTS